MTWRVKMQKRKKADQPFDQSALDNMGCVGFSLLCFRYFGLQNSILRALSTEMILTPVSEIPATILAYLPLTPVKTKIILRTFNPIERIMPKILTRLVLFERCFASLTFSKLSSLMTTSLASMAASEPSAPLLLSRRFLSSVLFLQILFVLLLSLFFLRMNFV